MFMGWKYPLVEYGISVLFKLSEDLLKRLDTRVDLGTIFYPGDRWIVKAYYSYFRGWACVLDV